MSQNFYLNFGRDLQTMLLEQTKIQIFNLSLTKGLPIWGLSFLYLNRLLGVIIDA